MRLPAGMIARVRSGGRATEAFVRTPAGLAGLVRHARRRCLRETTQMNVQLGPHSSSHVARSKALNRRARNHVRRPRGPMRSAAHRSCRRGSKGRREKLTGGEQRWRPLRPWQQARASSASWPGSRHLVSRCACRREVAHCNSVSEESWNAG